MVRRTARDCPSDRQWVDQGEFMAVRDKYCADPLAQTVTVVEGGLQPTYASDDGGSQLQPKEGQEPAYGFILMVGPLVPE